MKIIVLILGMFFFMSCENMEDVHKKYIADGEIIYRVKPTTIKSYSGYNQAKLTWNLVCPKLVTQCRIEENNSLLAELPVVYEDTVRMECILNNLEEKTHTFSIYTLDAEGNTSLKSEIIVDVYGAKYETNLRTNISLKSVWRKADNSNQVLIGLSEQSSSKVVKTRVYYKNVDGKEAMQEVKTGEKEIVLEQVAEDSYFKLQDVYMPVENCIDGFPAGKMREYPISEIPIVGSRCFKSIYKSDDHTVKGVLTTSDEAVTHSIISYGETRIEIMPMDSEVVLNNVKDNDKILVKTFLKDKNGVEYFAPIRSYSVSDISHEK